MLYGLFTQPDHSLDRGSLRLMAVMSGNDQAEADINFLSTVLSAAYEGEGFSFFWDSAKNLVLDTESLEREYFGWDFDPTLTEEPVVSLETHHADAVKAFISGDIEDELGELTVDEIQAAMDKVEAARQAAAEAEAKRHYFKSGQPVYHVRQRTSHHKLSLYKAQSSYTTDDYILESEVDLAAGKAAVEVYPYPQSVNRSIKVKDRMLYWGHLKSDPSVEYFGRTQKEVHTKAAIELAVAKRG